MLYLLPMENIQTQRNRKILKIKQLKESPHNTLWKILGVGMEKMTN
jgi:hypothetical protein